MTNSPSLPKAPDWLISQLKGETSAFANTNATPHRFLSEGSRNNDLTSIAGFLRKKSGLDADGLFVAIDSINQAGANPLPEEEVRAIARSVASYPSGGTPNLQDLPLSRCIAESIAPRCRYVPEWGWMNWAGTNWNSDMNGSRTREIVKQQLEAIYEGIKSTGDTDTINKARTLLSAGKVNATMGLIESDQILRADVAEFDLIKEILNVTNGTLDLQTLDLDRHEPTDLLTKVAKPAYDPTATCPHFDELLRATMPADHATFVLRLFGYALLGNPVEQVFAIFSGMGANGKSTLLNAVANALGDYSTNVEPSSFIKQKNERVRNDLARLKGARLVSTSELATGEILDAALVKRFTGGDNITARALYKEYFEFQAEFVVFMTTNALPVIDGGDAALGRRIIIVPFRNVIPEGERDRHLPRKLEEEASGILNRLLEGLAEYRRVGLDIPYDLKAEAAQFCVSSDMLAIFIEEECESDPDATVRAQILYFRYQTWCGANGLRAMSQPQFRREMIKKIEKSPTKTKAGSMWPGMRMRKQTIL